MSVRVNVRMSKIMRRPIKVGVRRYATYANGRTLHFRCNYYFLVKNSLEKIAVWHRKYSHALFLFLIFYPWRLTGFDFL